MRRQGFTLIELLVVVAIIALLIAILMPSLNRARAVAKSVVCGANQRQIGLAMLGYTIDHRGLYPAGHTWPVTGLPGHTDSWITWITQTRLYTEGSTDVFWCPAADPESKWVKQTGSGLGPLYGYEADEVRVLWNQKFSYGLNNWGTVDFSVPQLGMGSVPDHSKWGYIATTDIRMPARMITIGDSFPDGAWDAFIDHNQPTEYPHDRHLEKVSILWADGHVETRKQEEIVDPVHIHPEKRVLWNNDHKPH